MSQTLTVTLTNRRPVRIDTRAWPAIASAADDSYRGNDYARYQQALYRGEVDQYRLTVRQHADGRALVYGVLDAADVAWSQPAGGESIRGGELLMPGDDVPAAIARVAVACNLPGSLARRCVASLPVEDLVGL
jgi:hypothetical protein